MKTVAIASALIGSAAAFAPAQTGGPASSALHLKTVMNDGTEFASELGVQPPIGFWDPLGMLDGADQERFERLRFVEIKHGRVCMLAFLGQITTRAGIHLPGDIDLAGNSFDSFPNGWAAIWGDSAIPASGIIQIAILVGFLELGVMKDVTGENEFVGDFRNGSLDFGWDTFDEETELFKRG